MEKVKSVTHKCGCRDAYNKSYDALEKLNKSLDQETFETSRYQISKANIDAKDVLLFLDECRNDPTLYLKSDEASLVLREQQLLEQQRKLLEDQKRLEQLMQEQQRKQEELALQLEAKLSAQKALKHKAESGIKELEVLVTKLIETMGCSQNFPIVQEYYRTLATLEEESMEATRIFYSEKIKELAFGLINNLNACDQNR